MSAAPSLGIPPIAGVASYAEAARPGYSVDRNVALLRRCNYVERRLVDTYHLRLTGTPEWEAKGAFALHVWHDAEHVKWMCDRAHEMRRPPLYMEKAPDERIEAFMDELLSAGDTLELLVGIYGVAKPALIAAYEKHFAETNPLCDNPTRRILRFMILEEKDHVAWGEPAIAALSRAPEAAARAEAWRDRLRRYLAAAGGITGDEPRPEGALPAARHAAAPFRPSFQPARDARFQESFNFNFTPFVISNDPARDARERTLALMCRRLLEMDVPEMMASIVAETKDKPWEYYADLSRQIWDEARHSMMGEIYFESKGIDWTKIPLPVQFPLILNNLRTAKERHAVLFSIEHNLMRPDTGKKRELEISQAAGDPLASTFQDYDWADEVLHKNIGLTWLKGEFKNVQNILRFVEETQRPAEFDAVKQKYAAESKTPQRDWWPDFVKGALGEEAAARSASTERKELPGVFVNA